MIVDIRFCGLPLGLFIFNYIRRQADQLLLNNPPPGYSEKYDFSRNSKVKYKLDLFSLFVMQVNNMLFCFSPIKNCPEFI